MAEDKITKNTIVRTTELATVLGLSIRRIQQLIQDGTVTTVDRGKMYLADAVQEYIKFATKNVPDEESQGMERRKLEAEVRLKESKAQKAQLEADELQGKMHRAEDVETITSDIIFAIRSALVSLPGRLAVDVAAAETAAEVSQIIRSEVFNVMNELAQHKYDPQKYQELVHERMEWEMAELEEAGDNDAS